MKSLIVADRPTVNVLAERLKKAHMRSEYQRIQCILLRVTIGATAQDIAQVLGWSVNTVRVMHSRYAREGNAVFDIARRGGRRRQNMTLEEEAEFLAPFIEKADRGGILVVSGIKASYEARLGREVAESTVYRLLHRHNWRKIAPRRRHPKADPAAQAAFKKTPGTGR